MQKRYIILEEEQIDTNVFHLDIFVEANLADRFQRRRFFLR